MRLSLTILCSVFTVLTVQAKELQAKADLNRDDLSIALLDENEEIRTVDLKSSLRVELKDYAFFSSPLKRLIGAKQLVIKSGSNSFNFNIPPIAANKDGKKLINKSITGQPAHLQIQSVKLDESKIVKKKLVECIDPTLPPHASYAGNPLNDRDIMPAKLKFPPMIETEVEESRWNEYQVYLIYDDAGMAVRIITEAEPKTEDKIVGSLSACFKR